MFRIIRNASYRKLFSELDIFLTFTDESFDSDGIAAATIHHPANIKNRDRMNVHQFRVYNDLLDTVEGIIVSSGLHLDNSYQSKKSYAYYFDFHDDNNKLYRFRFRIADYEMKTKSENKSSAMSVKSKWITIVRSIVIGKNHEFESPTQAIEAIFEICNELVAGNTDAMLRRYNFHSVEGRGE